MRKSEAILSSSNHRLLIFIPTILPTIFTLEESL